jgi:hypothetical protein
MIKRSYSLIQILSLDVVIGAIISSLFIAKLFDVVVTINMMIGLGIAIWLTYTVDHLLDGHFAADQPKNERHAFHKVYKKKLIALSSIVFLFGLLNLAYLPWVTIKMGLALILIVPLYFASLHTLKIKKTWHKELVVALVYTVGVFVPPISLIAELDTLQWIVLLQFFLLALTNLFLFPLFEYEMDSADQLQSIVTIKGMTYVSKLTLGLITINTLFIGYAYWSGLALNVTLIFLAMNAVLFALWRWPSSFQGKALYRLCGDGIFFIPLIYFWL